MKEEIISNLLGEITIAQFIAYFIFAILGLITSFLIEIMRHNCSIKTSGGFSIKYWLSDNISRGLLSIIAIIVGITCSVQVLNMQPSNWEAFSAGLITDKILEAIIKLKDSLTPNKS